ncbi:MAG: hypothetical protein QOI05_4140 [Bradyrhizobium sp.]|jgi:uncharacterized protein with HEPN domain|nr:hypothetical protein [Bradyrhizobium sp.]
MADRILSLRFADIIEAIDNIRSILDGASLKAFEGDWQKRWLVERGLEIISEASRHLPETVKAVHPEIPWLKVAGIGNVLRHSYDRIAPDILWKLAQDDLSTLYDVCCGEYRAALARER